MIRTKKLYRSSSRKWDFYIQHESFSFAPYVQQRTQHTHNDGWKIILLTIKKWRWRKNIISSSALFSSSVRENESERCCVGVSRKKHTHFHKHMLNWIIRDRFLLQRLCAATHIHSWREYCEKRGMDQHTQRYTECKFTHTNIAGCLHIIIIIICTLKIYIQQSFSPLFRSLARCSWREKNIMHYSRGKNLYAVFFPSLADL